MTISLDEMFSRKKILSELPGDSILAKILPMESEPSLILYGPTKGGKTRLAAWEATTLASKLNRRVHFILTESNVEPEDIRDILAACIYHNVYCKVERFDHLRALSAFAGRLERTVMKAIKKENEEELALLPRVYVIDSITSLANLALEGLPENVVDSGSPTTLPYIYPRLTKIVNPLRRLMSADYLNGYLIMTAHETQLRGEIYVPGTNIKSKPKYAGTAQYNDDTEIYLGSTRDLPDTLKTCDTTRNEASKYRPIVVAVSRRHPTHNGYGAAITFVRLGEDVIPKRRRRGRKSGSSEESGEKTEAFVGSGEIRKTRDVGGIIYEFIPKDMMGDESMAEEITVKPLMPVIGCGPKYVK